MAPQRSASAPLPPFVRSSQKGVRVVRLSSAPCAYRLPCPHPSPHSLRSLPPPTPGGGFNYICYTINEGNTQPRPHPPPARARPSSPLALGRSGRSVRPLAAPRAAPGGFDYIFYTTQNHYCVSAPDYPPQQQWPLCSPLATFCRRLRRLRLLQTHARGERC